MLESSDVENADDVDGLLGDGEGTGEFGAQAPGTAGGGGGVCACMSIAYYRPFFDVDTDEVVGRLKAALLFFAAEPFLTVVRNKPDAYGPWWVATTLVFLVSVTSHVKALLHYGDDYEYDFTTVTFSASLSIEYVLL